VDAGPAALLKALDSDGGVRIGVHEVGPRPELDPGAYDILLSADADPPEPWVGLGAGLSAGVAAVTAACEQRPVAATVAVQLLRTTLQVSFEAALELESVAYSMLLASQEFKDWRARTPVRDRAEPAQPRVLVGEAAGAISIRLNRPARRNAFDAAMRDELTEALAFALEHPDRPPVILTGEGPAFSAGGDLDEFGTAQDVGLAHMIRTLRSPARAAHALADRLTVRLHGACVGAGIEVPAAAARVTAAPSAVFRLPEVAMGLIPGAGGTASIPRRIGRHRAAYMAISGAEIDLATALDWGLVDASP
jgi:hypothetical protein